MNIQDVQLTIPNQNKWLPEQVLLFPSHHSPTFPSQHHTSSSPHRTQSNIRKGVYITINVKC